MVRIRFRASTAPALVIPAKAGIQFLCNDGFPVKRGMTGFLNWF